MTPAQRPPAEEVVTDVQAKPPFGPESSARPLTREALSMSDLYDIPAPRRARWSLRIMVVGMLLLIWWASVGKIDQVTRAQAQIIAAERTQLVQSSESGVLTQLHVKEGDVVKAGQLLATLQKERASAAVSDSK
ncbi:MAG: biotin/lipoyl-binding protein, partial [Burkholderiaceae bacterium]